MTATEFLGNSISLESAMSAFGRKRTSKSGYFSSIERPLSGKADIALSVIAVDLQTYIYRPITGRCPLNNGQGSHSLAFREAI